MDIGIFLTILLTIISLGGWLLQEGRISLISWDRFILTNSLFTWAAKLVLKHLCLLNTVISIDTQKATQTTLIQPQNHKFEG
ncbi:hypothetical protein [Falsiporphyromonas endometrii]|uniref:Uncharacterized protein n=1 Tax=Falsiporphyromonas endometrii TaxID=1387297 RepID=A0ABV9K7D5_9PORP